MAKRSPASSFSLRTAKTNKDLARSGGFFSHHQVQAAKGCSAPNLRHSEPPPRWVPQHCPCRYRGQAWESTRCFGGERPQGSPSRSAGCKAPGTAATMQFRRVASWPVPADLSGRRGTATAGGGGRGRDPHCLNHLAEAQTPGAAERKKQSPSAGPRPDARPKPTRRSRRPPPPSGQGSAPPSLPAPSPPAVSGTSTACPPRQVINTTPHANQQLSDQWYPGSRPRAPAVGPAISFSFSQSAASSRDSSRPLTDTGLPPLPLR